MSNERKKMKIYIVYQLFVHLYITFLYGYCLSNGKCFPESDVLIGSANEMAFH